MPRSIGRRVPSPEVAVDRKIEGIARTFQNCWHGNHAEMGHIFLGFCSRSELITT